MKAVMFKGNGKMAVEEIEDARIEQPTDVLIRITSTGICGSDLHMFEGRTTAKPGMAMGHENMGVIEEIGDAVQQLRVGDRAWWRLSTSRAAPASTARADSPVRASR